jgi:hypothetical protein
MLPQILAAASERSFVRAAVEAIARKDRELLGAIDAGLELFEETSRTAWLRGESWPFEAAPPNAGDHPAPVQDDAVVARTMERLRELAEAAAQGSPRLREWAADREREVSAQRRPLGWARLLMGRRQRSEYLGDVVAAIQRDPLVDALHKQHAMRAARSLARLSIAVARARNEQGRLPESLEQVAFRPQNPYVNELPLYKIAADGSAELSLSETETQWRSDFGDEAPPRFSWRLSPTATSQ